MKTLKQAIVIQATPATIWSAIISDHKYRIWTDVFQENSQFSGVWQIGEELQFTDGVGGILAKVTTLEYPDTIELNYIGIVDAGTPIYLTSEASDWARATETYSLASLAPDLTRFSVEISCPNDAYLEFEQMWSEGMIAFKHVCESSDHDFTSLTVSQTVDKPVADVWSHWTTPTSITSWNFASPDWHCPTAVHDFRVGGHFSYTMAARDESFQFDYSGTFTAIVPNEYLQLLLDDGRQVAIHFIKVGETTAVFEVFDAETQNSHELQLSGWQAILDNFVTFVLTR